MIELVNAIRACSASQIQQASLPQQEQVCPSKIEPLDVGLQPLLFQAYTY